MRFLVDNQLPPSLARWLRDRGHDAEHVFESGLHLLEWEKVPATKNGETGILPRFGGWHHFSIRPSAR
jgi:uncharacterized protein with PIN domain